MSCQRSAYHGVRSSNWHFRREHFYGPDDGVVTLLCGPEGLIEKAALPGLEEIGFERGENVFGF